MLTKRQMDLFKYLDSYISEHDGLAPSFDEMREAIGLKSKSGIFLLMKGLQDRGFIRTIPNRARAVEILKYPPFFNEGKDSLEPVEIANDMINVPIYGKIAAGTPIEAIKGNGEDMVQVSSSMVGAGNFYALKVEGDSMIEAGIHDGDRVVIKDTSNARDGEIVVALIDEEEVTLKYIRNKDGKVRLIPANPQYDERVLDPNRVKVQGVLAMLLRSYH